MYWPLPLHPDGRKPSISDGWHTQRDLDLLKATRVHLGVDFMYRRPKKGKSVLPDSSPHYECPQGTPCLAVADGRVVVSEDVRRGGYLMIDHGEGFATQYMHLETRFYGEGDSVRAGQAIGLVGYDIAGYKLRHLHFQCRRGFKTVKLSGVRINPEPLIKTWKILDRPVREACCPSCRCSDCLLDGPGAPGRSEG